MKESLFNVYFDAPDGKKLAFNSLSCGLAIVDESYEFILKNAAKIHDKKIDEIYNDTLQAAIAGKFLVPDDFDEILDFSMKRYGQKFNDKSLGLTIAPTLACNFKCVYCYETSTPGVISDITQSNIIKFIKSREKYLEKLDISWYGGEPLLAFKEIAKMSESFLNICNDNAIAYNAFMISNGSLFTADIIDQMQKYHIKGVQITLDGPKDIHDARRICKNGESKFDCIVDNINSLLSNNIEVMIRINIDKSNEERLEELISYLSNVLVNKDIKISFGKVTAYTEACKTIEGSCFNNMEFAKKIIEYYTILNKYGFGKLNAVPYPSARLNYCCADIFSSFVIDPEGNLYKCWNDVGIVNSSIGNINVPNFDLYNFKHGEWVLNMATLADKCKKCDILPICNGGCPHARLSNKQDDVCDLIRYNIKDIMLWYYSESLKR